MSKKRKLKPGKLVPIAFDKAFKKMWGNENGKRRIALLLSKYFNVDYHDILDNIEFLNVEYTKDNKDDKAIMSDILVKINLNSPDKKRVNLEMNLDKYNPNIERNLSYLCKIFYDSTKDLKDYREVDSSIQLNFNTAFVGKKNNKVIKEYLMRTNEYDFYDVVTEKFKMVEINIDECRKVWYSNTINEYPEHLRDLIRLGALMTIDDKDTFDKCLEEIDMEKDVKDDIKKTVDNYSKDDTLIIPWTVEEDKQRNYNTAMSLVRDEGLEEGKKLGLDEGMKNKSMAIAEQMLKEKENIDKIILYTGLTREEIAALDK